MYAIVDYKGTQFKVEKDMIVKVPFISDAEIGSEIEMDRILLLNDDSSTKVGDPVVKDVKVIAEVLAHAKSKKIIVFKKKSVKATRKNRVIVRITHN